MSPTEGGQRSAARDMQDAHAAWSAGDAFLLLLMIAVATIQLAVRFQFTAHPAEDAAILLRYAIHVAHAQGIVWNVGEPPSDGATDFLFMMAVAGLVKAGVGAEAAARALGIGAHLLTLVVIFAASRRWLGASRWAALVSALYLALGPGLAYAEACFGTPVFTLFTCLAAAILFHQAIAGETLAGAAGFAVAALAGALVRPEGVFLAALLAASLVLYRGWHASRLTLTCFLVLFAAAGGLFLAWRWRYFGHLLPTPFLKKGAFHLHPEGLESSLQNGLLLCLPFLPAFVTGLRSRPAARLALLFAVPAGGFLALWVLLSGEMNVLMRFQYPVLPLVLLAWPCLIAGIGERWLCLSSQSLTAGDRRAQAALLALYAIGTIGYGSRLYRHQADVADGRYAVAVELSRFRDEGYTLATSEAGLLPLYSGWRSIDTWGLNDVRLARHALTSLDLAREQPAVIMFHAYFSPASTIAGAGDWFHMTNTLRRYAEERHYVLAACYGTSPYETHYYYVRPDLPDAAAIVRAIRVERYAWLGSSLAAVDFSHLERAAP